MNTEQSVSADDIAAAAPSSNPETAVDLSSVNRDEERAGEVEGSRAQFPSPQPSDGTTQELPAERAPRSGGAREPAGVQGIAAAPSPIISQQSPFPDRRSPIAPPTEIWPEPVDGQLLLDELRRTFSRFVVLPALVPETLALWVLHTYAFQLGDVSAYLGIESPVKRCGKTTLLSVLDKLAHRPVLAANISFKAFFHVIEHARPTLLIDETDTFLPANDELRGILNAGYHRDTAFVIRFAQAAESSTGENLPAVFGHAARVAPESAAAAAGLPGTAAPRESNPPNTGAAPAFIGHASRIPHQPASALSRFSCWCPKAMASIGRLPDTLADRCIRICMHRKTPSEKCERLRNLQPATLKGQCARFVLDHQEAIAAARPEIPAALNDRAGDIWEPLLVLADLAGGEWPDLSRKAALALSGAAQAQDNDNPVDDLFSTILKWILFKRCKRIFSRDLVETLNSLAEFGSPWCGMLKGKPVTELWLANTLRPYGIHPKRIRQGEITKRGYLAEDFAEAFERYLPRYEAEAAPTEPDPASPSPQGSPPAENPETTNSLSPPKDAGSA